METSYRLTMKTAMQQLHEHLINSWSAPGDLWKPDKIIEKVESMIEMEKKNTMENTLQEICGNCGLKKSDHEGTGFTDCPKPFGGLFQQAFTIENARENMHRLYGSAENMTKEQYCEHCGNEIIEARYTSPTVKHRFCSTQCTEDFFEHKRRSFEEGEWTSSGSVAAPKEEDLSPEEILKKHFEVKGYIFDHFKNWLDFRVHLPTIYAAMGEYAAIHAHAQVMNQVNIMKQLKEREEALKELLTIAIRYRNTINLTTREDEFKEIKAIIEKARNLLSK